MIRMSFYDTSQTTCYERVFNQPVIIGQSDQTASLNTCKNSNVSQNPSYSTLLEGRMQNEITAL